MAADLMDIVSENNAFPLDAGAIQIRDEKIILLVTISLNTPKDINEYDNYKNILQILDYIHCKAFGTGTNIHIEKSGDGTSCSMNFGVNIPSHLILLVSAVGENIEDIILMSILTEHHDVQQGGAFAGQVDDYVTIWSVAKNPAIDFPNAFGVFLEKLKEINEFSTYQKFKLQVDPANTLRMTEQGRIRLYTSLGFNIDIGTVVETIYPERIYYFRRHEDGNVGRIYLMISKNEDEKCDFIGNLKSHQKNPIPMTSTREALGVYRDIYCEYKESFKGNKIISTDASENTIEIDPPFGVLKNSDVDLSPLLESLAPTSATSSSATTTTTTSSSAATPLPSFTVLKTLYHMNLIKIKNNRDNYIKYCEVPDDFIVISLNSPGSLLRQYSTMLFDNYMLNILPFMDNNLIFKHLLETHRSTATLPLYNIKEHDELVANATKAPSSNDPDLFNRQLYNSILNSIIMDSMGRQPIFEIPVRKINQARVPGTGQLVKKEQYDIQIYTPGMRMFDYQVSRESMSGLVQRGAITKEQARSDDIGLLGTYMVTKNEWGQFSTKTQIDDSPFVNSTEGMFSDYFNYIRATVPISPGAKYILFAFGCAPLIKAGMTLTPYELLYELSHRRSIVYTFPPGTRVDSQEFINTAVFNKHILTEHDCSIFHPEEAAKRSNLKKHLNSITVEMHTGSPTTTTSSSSTTPSLTEGAGSGTASSRGGKRKKRFPKTKRASSRKMATRFRKLRTRKTRKSKAFKTRKSKGGATSTMITLPPLNTTNITKHPIFNTNTLKKMESNEKKAVLQILENEKEALITRKKERISSLNLHESLRQQFTKSKEENEEKLKKYEDSKNVKNSQNFQNLKNKYIDNLKEYIKSRIFMIDQEERLIKYVKNEIEKIDKNIQEVEMKIKKIQNA